MVAWEIGEREVCQNCLRVLCGKQWHTGALACIATSLLSDRIATVKHGGLAFFLLWV